MSRQAPHAAPPGKVPVIRGISVLPPLTALAEIAILFLLIYTVDQLTPNLAILDLSPHPFWIPVLLVSLQYGTVSGFIAAAVAIALSLFAGLPEQDIGENLFAYFLRVLGQPILWIGVALLVGQFRMRQLEAKQELRLANQTLTQQREDLAHHARDLRRRVEEIEQELATRYASAPHTPAAVLTQAMDEGGLRADTDLQAVFARAAIALFPDAVVTAYRLRDGVMAECAVCGRLPDTGPRIRITREDPLFRAIIDERRSLSVLTSAGENLLGRTGLAAVPIPAATVAGPDPLAASPATHEPPAASVPFGMLVIEHADPAAITGEGLMALEMLAHALSPRPPRPAAARVRDGAPVRRIRSVGMAAVPARPKAAQRADAPSPRIARDRRAMLVDRLTHGPETAHASVSISTPVPQAADDAGAPDDLPSPAHTAKPSSSEP